MDAAIDPITVQRLNHLLTPVFYRFFRERRWAVSKLLVEDIGSCFSKTLFALQENMNRMAVFEQDAASVDCVRTLIEKFAYYSFDVVIVMNALAFQLMSTAHAHFYDMGNILDDDGNIVDHGHFELMSNSDHDMLMQLEQALERCNHGIPLPFGKQLILLDDIIREDFGAEFCQLIGELLATE